MRIDRIDPESFQLEEVKALLTRVDLDFEPFTILFAGYEQEKIVACGALDGNILKMFAVDPLYQELGYTDAILAALLKEGSEQGHEDLFIFTKSEYKNHFHQGGFILLADTGKVVLLHRGPHSPEAWLANHPPRRNGVAAIVMNANPMTNGHLELVKQAARENFVLVFVVEENRSDVPFATRFTIVQETLKEMDNVQVLPSGPYIISSKTFPTYFMKAVNERSREYAKLDALLFKKYFVPFYGITKRYLGSEPMDLATAQYNETLLEILPPECEVIIMDRLETDDGKVITASRVREAAKLGQFDAIKEVVPKATWEYLNDL